MFAKAEEQGRIEFACAGSAAESGGAAIAVAPNESSADNQQDDFAQYHDDEMAPRSGARVRRVDFREEPGNITSESVDAASATASVTSQLRHGLSGQWVGGLVKLAGIARKVSDVRNSARLVSQVLRGPSELD